MLARRVVEDEVYQHANAALVRGSHEAFEVVVRSGPDGLIRHQGGAVKNVERLAVSEPLRRELGERAARFAREKLSISIAAETTDYSKKSFEKSRVLAEKLIAVKKLDEALQLQSDFAKSAYEDFLAEATKLGELYTSMAKEAFKPIESATKAYSPAE